eukprot:4259568-Amphidinium_carterae.2
MTAFKLQRLAEFYQIVETQGFWPESLRDLLLLQLPKAGAVNAGERRPIALMPVIYRIWASSCKPRLLSWRGQRLALGHTPVGRGALDEAFDLSLEVEELSGQGVPVAGVFLDCSKRYERVSLCGLETAARQAGFPESVLQVALNMYKGRRRVLVNGAVSSAYQARSGLPAGCALAVDLLDCFLSKVLGEASSIEFVRVAWSI